MRGRGAPGGAGARRIPAINKGLWGNPKGGRKIPRGAGGEGGGRGEEGVRLGVRDPAGSRSEMRGAERPPATRGPAGLCSGMRGGNRGCGILRDAGAARASGGTQRCGVALRCQVVPRGEERSSEDAGRSQGCCPGMRGSTAGGRGCGRNPKAEGWQAGLRGGTRDAVRGCGMLKAAARPGMLRSAAAASVTASLSPLQRRHRRWGVGKEGRGA